MLHDPFKLLHAQDAIGGGEGSERQPFPGTPALGIRHDLSDELPRIERLPAAMKTQHQLFARFGLEVLDDSFHGARRIVPIHDHGFALARGRIAVPAAHVALVGGKEGDLRRSILFGDGFHTGGFLRCIEDSSLVQELQCRLLLLTESLRAEVVEGSKQIDQIRIRNTGKAQAWSVQNMVAVSVWKHEQVGCYSVVFTHKSPPPSSQSSCRRCRSTARRQNL